MNAKAPSFLYERVKHSPKPETFKLTFFINWCVYSAFFVTEFSHQQCDNSMYY